MSIKTTKEYGPIYGLVCDARKLACKTQIAKDRLDGASYALCNMVLMKEWFKDKYSNETYAAFKRVWKRLGY